MHGPDGTDYPNPASLSKSWSISTSSSITAAPKKGGRPRSSSHVDFEKEGDKTRLTMRCCSIPPPPAIWLSKNTAPSKVENKPWPLGEHLAPCRRSRNRHHSRVHARAPGLEGLDRPGTHRTVVGSARLFDARAGTHLERGRRLEIRDGRPRRHGISVQASFSKSFPCRRSSPRMNSARTSNFAGMNLPAGIVVTSLFEGRRPDPVTLGLCKVGGRPPSARAMGVVPGWNSSLDCLEEHLAAM